MKCHEFEDVLLMYAYGEASETGRRVVEQHIEVCPECRDTATAYRAVMEVASRSSKEEPPESVLDAVHRAAVEAAGSVTRRPWFTTRRGMAAAACVTLLLGIGALTAAKFTRTPASVEPVHLPESVIAQAPVEVSDPVRLEIRLPLPVPAAEEMDVILANIEDDATSMHRMLASERRPVFDRRMQSVEDMVYLLSASLEQER